MSEKKINIAKTASIIIIFNLLSKFLGFLRDYLTAIKFGTSVQADSYLMASNIPNTLFVLIGVAITTTFVPIYNDIKVNRSKKELSYFTSNIITILIIFSVLMTLLCEIFAPNLVKIMAPGFSGAKFNLTVTLTRILASVIILNTVIYIFMSILQCEENFKTPAAVGIPYNIILIIYYLVFSNTYGVFGISVMISVGLLLQLVMLYLSLKKMNFKYKIRINFRDNDLKKMIVLLLPITIGTGMQQINALFNGIYASSLSSGTVASLNYALKLNALVIDIIIMSIITVSYQSLSKSAAIKDYKGIAQISNKTIIFIFIVLIPIVTTILVLSTPIIRVLFQRGAFNAQGTKMTSTALYFYSIGLFGVGVNTVLSRVCYSLNDTKTPMINTFFAVLINVVLGYILKKFLGIGGIALASTIGTIASSIILYINIKDKIAKCITKRSLQKIIRLVISAIPMYIIMKILENVILRNNHNTLYELLMLILITLIGFVLYILNAHMLKVKEVSEVINILKLKLKFN